MRASRGLVTDGRRDDARRPIAEVAADDEGVLAEGFGVGFDGDLAVEKEERPGANAEGFCDVMVREKDGDAGFGQVGEQVAESAGLLGIDAGEGFVTDQNLRRTRNRTREFEP